IQKDPSIVALYKHPLWTPPAMVEAGTEATVATLVQATETIEIDLDSTKEIEDVSVYHDEHLPYSFLWWLNKTRMEFAHTYRPYAPLKQRGNMAEHHVLDQQIRENIFHLQ